MSERTCRVCGCTDERACPGGCWWVEADLCSTCRPPATGGLYTGPPVLMDLGDPPEYIVPWRGKPFLAPAMERGGIRYIVDEPYTYLDGGQLDLGLIYDLPSRWHPIARWRKRRLVRTTLTTMLEAQPSWDQRYPDDAA